MATGVLFGNPRSVIYQPGAYTEVDASALALSGAFAINTVCIIGQGLGGEPMRLYKFNDASQAQKLFGTQSPLGQAITFAFRGGVNGGAPLVIGVRADNTAKASGVLAAPNGTQIRAVHKDFGGYGNTFSITFLPGSQQGTQAIIRGTQLDGTTYRQTIDNIVSFSELIQRITEESVIDVDVLAGGVAASQTLTLATNTEDGRATITDQSNTDVSTQAYLYQHPASIRQDSQTSLVAAFDRDVGFDVTLDSANNTLTGIASLVNGSPVKLAGTTLPDNIDPDTTYYAVNVVTNPAAGAGVATRLNAITPTTKTVTAGQTTPENIVVEAVDAAGNPVSGFGLTFNIQSGDGDLTAGPSVVVPPTATSQTFQLTTIPGGAPIQIAGTLADGRMLLGFGQTRISNVVPGELAGSYAVSDVKDRYTLSVTNATLSRTAYGTNIFRVNLTGTQVWGHANGNGVIGSIFQIATGPYAGTYQIAHYEWSGLGNDKTRTVIKLTPGVIPEGVFSASFAFWPVVLFPRAQPATEAIETALPSDGILYRGGQFVTVTLEVEAGNTLSAYYATQPGDTIEGVGQELARQINASDEWKEYAIASAAYNGATFTSTLTLTATDPGIVGNDYKPGIVVNTQTTLLVASQGTTLGNGVDPEPPKDALGNTTGSVNLTAGYDSVPTYQRYLEALRAIQYEPLRWVVCLSQDAAVQAAFVDHCEQASTTRQRHERVAIMGHGLGWTPRQVMERARSFNSERAIFCSPGLQMANIATGTGIKTYSSAQATTALVAGMLAAEGNGISDPITHTFFTQVYGAELQYVSGSVELDEVLQSGVLAIEKDPTLTRESRGWRVVRAITTWRQSNVWESITTINQSDFIAQDIRDVEETLFIGKALVPSILPMIAETANARLLRRSEEGVIYGFDPEFTKASINPDSQSAVDLTYKIYPAPALEFILNNQLLFPIPETSVAA